MNIPLFFCTIKAEKSKILIIYQLSRVSFLPASGTTNFGFRKKFRIQPDPDSQHYINKADSVRKVCSPMIITSMSFFMVASLHSCSSLLAYSSADMLTTCSPSISTCQYGTSVAESEPPGAELFCIEPYLGRLPHLFCTITVAVDLFFTYEYLLVLVDNLRIEVNHLFTFLF